MLIPIGREIWIADGPTVSFFGFPYPTRMAVARLPGARLWLWSPIEPSPQLCGALNELGTVRWLVAPNKLHHLFLASWQREYPAAELHGAPGLARRRPDLRFAAELSAEPAASWLPEIAQVVVAGSLAMDEVVFLHRPSCTALVCDLIQKHEKSAFSGWRRFAMQLDGLVGENGSTPREWRATFVRRKQARAALRTMLDWKPEKLVLAHGPCFRENARDVIASSLRWIGGAS